MEIDYKARFQGLLRELHTFLDRKDTIDQMPMHLYADLDQIIIENELDASYAEEASACVGCTGPSHHTSCPEWELPY